MKKTAKAWYITAAALVLMGCVLFIGVMSSVGWDVSRLSAVSFETRIHEIAEPFRDLSLTTDTANIVFAPARRTGTAAWRASPLLVNARVLTHL